jgi:2-phosphoglycerate kinase
MVWSFKEMIILITGASHTGKTVLAQRLLEKYKYPYLSMDHLKMGLIRSGNTELTPCDEETELTSYLWPIVSEIIKTAIENKQNLIVEGCYVPGDWKTCFDEEYLSEIKFICLIMTNEYIDGHFTDIVKHGSDIESRGDDSDCTVRWIKEANSEFADRFPQNQIIIDKDYETAINTALNFLGN